MSASRLSADSVVAVADTLAIFHKVLKAVTETFQADKQIFWLSQLGVSAWLLSASDGR